MIDEINSFTTYLQEVKHTAKNTEVSYHRDLVQMAGFMEKMGITHVEKVTKTSSFIWKKKEKQHPPFPGNWLPLRHFLTIFSKREK